MLILSHAKREQAIRNDNPDKGTETSLIINDVKRLISD